MSDEEAWWFKLNVVFGMNITDATQRRFAELSGIIIAASMHVRGRLWIARR
jgi:hypothetical protein